MRDMRKTVYTCMLCLLLIVPATVFAGNHPEEKPPLTVEDIWGEGSLTGRLPRAVRWLPDNSGISCFETGEEDSTEQTLFTISYVPSGKKQVLCIVDTVTVPNDLKEGDNTTFSMNGYRWAKTAAFTVFTFKSDIFMFRPANGEVRRITSTEESEDNITISPDAKKIAFVREHDLYIIDLDHNIETRVTETGCDTILNGELDWVYMEELYTRGNTNAYRWSPDSKRIAFLEFNESPVPEFPLVSYDDLHASLEMQRYPKAGDPNPLVRIGIYDINSGTTRWLDSVKGDDDYVARFDWVESEPATLALQILNRPQTDLALTFVNASTGTARMVIAERDTNWINLNYKYSYYETKKRMVWSSERDGYDHLYLYENNGDLVRQLTKGPWIVSDLDGIDEREGMIYFSGLEKSILEQHLYAVPATGGPIKRISKEDGYHRIAMSENCRYYIDNFSTASQPSVITVHRNNGKRLFTLGASSTDSLDAHDVAWREFFHFTSEEGNTYYCSMVKPSNFDPAKRYPVIIYVYGGPHAQMVSDRWGGSSALWSALMASKGYIVFRLDNRGSFGRGKAWETAVARELGSTELHDQLIGVEYLKGLPYVDASRIGIWGWSYGGTMTLTAVLKAPDVFKAGVAVAPVVDFRLYDSIYTERYMRTPEDNPDGYDAFDLVTRADQLSARLLLVHGTTDNNVHMQNTMQMIDALIDAGKDFDLMLYPDKRHGISGSKARVHLFKKITAFFENNL